MICLFEGFPVLFSHAGNLGNFPNTLKHEIVSFDLLVPTCDQFCFSLSLTYSQNDEEIHIALNS